MSKKLVLKVGDLKEKKIEEIKAHIGDYWHEGMRDDTLAELAPFPAKVRVDEVLDEIFGDDKRDVAAKVFKGMTEEEKDKVRKKGLAIGHDCYNCEDTSCVLHPDYTKPTSH